MKYEKANAEVVKFDKHTVFMTASPGAKCTDYIKGVHCNAYELHGGICYRYNFNSLHTCEDFTKSDGTHCGNYQIGCDKF